MSNFTAKEFNDSYPVGTVVRYYPIIGGEAFIETKTRTPAYDNACYGEPFVKLDGVVGGRSFDVITIVCPNCGEDYHISSAHECNNEDK